MNTFTTRLFQFKSEGCKLGSDYEQDNDLEDIAEKRAYYDINDELDLDITDVERNLM